jgi:hypothetical protein
MGASKEKPLYRMTQAELRAINIYNSGEIAKGLCNKLYIDYSASSHVTPSCWRVYGIGFQTDYNASWFDHHSKTFNTLGRDDKNTKLEMAKQWAENTYGVSGWVRDVWGGWHYTNIKIQEEAVAK